MEPYIPRLSHPARVWLRFGILLVALVLLFWLVYRLRAVFTPLLLGAAIAYTLNPLVTWVERRWGWQRLTVVILVFALTGALVLCGGFYGVSKLIAQVEQLQQNVPRYVQILGRAVSYSQQRFGRLLVTTRPVALPVPPGASPHATVTTTVPVLTTAPATSMPADWWLAAQPLLQEYGLSTGRRVLGYLQSALTNMINLITLLVLVPMFTFYFLWRFNEAVAVFRDHVPTGYRDTVVHIVSTIDRAVANFFRGRLLVCMLIGAFSATGWALVGLPYSLPLGLLAGALNLVPFLSLLAVPPALLLAYLSSSAAEQPWFWPVVLTFAVYMAAQALEYFLLSPLIEGRASGLHPLAIVVALLIGAELAGLAGMLLAIPVASTLRTFAAEWLLPEIRRLAAGPAARGA